MKKNSGATKGKFTSLLPPSWYTLYQLTKLTDEQFEERIADRTVFREAGGKACVYAPFESR